MSTLTVYRYQPITGPDDEPPSYTYLGDWDSKRASDAPLPDDYLWLDLMSGSDYSGSALEKSNHDVFLERFGTLDGVLDVYGGYGTYGVLICRDVYDSNPEIRECLAELDSYPALDDEHMSELERAAEDDAWDDWGGWACSDFRHALGKRFPELEDAIDGVPSDDLRDYFESACGDQNLYWENETGNSAWIDVAQVAADVDESALRDFLAAHAESSATA